MRTKGNKNWSNLKESKCPLCGARIEPAPLKKEKICYMSNDCNFVINKSSIERIVNTLEDRKKQVEYYKLRENLIRSGKSVYAKKLKLIKEYENEYKNN